jgi:hypothetical protein
MSIWKISVDSFFSLLYFFLPIVFSFAIDMSVIAE